MLYEKFSKWYAKNYKALMVIPLIAFLACSGIFIKNYTQKGEFFSKDIDLVGGTVVSVYVTSVQEGTKEIFESKGLSFREVKSLESGELMAVVIEAGPNFSKEEVEQLVNETFLGVEFDTRSVGPSMGESFMKSSIKAVVVAFILMGLILAFIFKKPIVAFTVILSGFLNVFEAAALMTLIGVELAPHTIGALLMLMGWSVDSEVLFDTKILKNSMGNSKKRALSAMKTAMTMSSAVFASLSALYFISTSQMIKDMALVLLLGAFFDIINTWFQSLSMVLWYAERNE